MSMFNCDVPQTFIVINSAALFSLKILCPFAVYYLRYAVRSFFIISRISAKERDKKYSVKSP
ncbi:MAG: hypothetical protein ACK56F_06970, partial [bacterium]